MRTKPDWRHFNFLSGDISWIDHGGTWARRLADGNWHVIRFQNIAECCGDSAVEKLGADYWVSLLEVDITLSEALTGALESCGWEKDTEVTDAMKVDACVNYGAFEHHSLRATNNANKVWSEMRKLSYELKPRAKE